MCVSSESHFSDLYIVHLIFKAICNSTGTGELESDEVRKELAKSLKYLRDSVVNDSLLSTFELSISGLVGALLSLLCIVSNKKDCSVAELFLEVTTGCTAYMLSFCVSETGRVIFYSIFLTLVLLLP